jgi:hypothetical protein
MASAMLLILFTFVAERMDGMYVLWQILTKRCALLSRPLNKNSRQVVQSTYATSLTGADHSKSWKIAGI